MFTTITNLSTTIITAYDNAYSLLWYSPNEDNRGELIEDILFNSNHFTLNTNTPTSLPPNQTQQPTLADITTASADLHDCTSWQTIHSLTSDHLTLLTTLSIHHKAKTTHFHFCIAITNYQKADWTSFKQHVEDFISYRPHSTNLHEANKHLIKTILNADRLFIPKGNQKSTNHTHLVMPICKLIYHCNHICKQNISYPQIITLNNHINRQIQKYETNN